ncbi:MAG TPA: glycosyltransferase family 39 protein [Chloroflexia bacterium]|nr:glycosyltransferase family 39 protein [Chloroflexia bacterium]
MALLLAVAAVFNGFTLLNYPATFVDEGWNASRSLALLQTGRQFAGVDSGVYQHFEGYWTYWPWLGSAIHAVAIQLLGLSLTTMRVVSLLFGLALLLVMFRLGASLVNRRTGFLAAGLLAVSLPFFYSSHMARHDIIVAAMGYGAIALQVTEARSAATGWKAFPFRSLLAGLLIGLGLDIHLNILVLVPVMGLLYLMDSGRAILKSKPFWAFGLGLAAGVLYYAAMHILPYPEGYAGVASLSNLTGRAPILFRADPAIWFEALMGTLWHLDLRMLPVMALAVFALARRGSSSDRTVLLIFAAVALTHLVVTSYKTYHYAIMVAPAAALLVSAFLDRVLQRPARTSLWGFARMVLVTGIVAGVAILNLSRVWGASNSGYDRTVEKMVQTIPEGAGIMGAPTFWFARPYQTYINWDQLEIYERRYPESSLADAFAYYKPEYFIMDGFIEYWLTDDPDVLNGEPLFPVLPKAEMWQILSERGTLLGEVETEPYGIVRIYKMAWQAP